MNRILAEGLLAYSKATLPFSSPLLTNHGRLWAQVSKIHQNVLEVPPNRRFCYAFSSCSASQDLTIKKCVPCNSKDIQPMPEQSARELLPQVQGWDMSSEDGVMKLHRSWKVKNFTKGLEFFQLLADVVEAEGHHPDLHLVGWNNVKIDIWTHSVGGLTENDFILAAKINSLKVEHILTRGKHTNVEAGPEDVSLPLID